MGENAIEVMAWWVPVLIFFARIADVSLGTVRTILMISGQKWVSACIGAVEVLIWVLAVGGALKHLDNPFALAGYALGFASGVVVGTWLEDKIALGYRVVRVICTLEHANVPVALRELGYRVTQFRGRGREAEVDLAFIVIRRRGLRKLRAELAEMAPNAFVTVERVDRPSGASWGDAAPGRRRLKIGQHLRK